MSFFLHLFLGALPGKTSKTGEVPAAEASAMAPAFAILASNDAAAKVAAKNSASAGVQLFQPLGTGWYRSWDHLG